MSKQDLPSHITTESAPDSEPDDTEPTLERQAELRRVYENNVEVGRPPYAGVKVGSRGELNWIVSERGWKAASEVNTASDSPDLRYTAIHCDLREVSLEFADLSKAILNNANFSGANFQGAKLNGAAGYGINLSGANLLAANLSDAILMGNFSDADMTYANLNGTLIGGDFSGAHLTHARMDAGTVLGSYLSDETFQMDAGTRLVDVSWNGAILALVNWDKLPRLGDEVFIKEATTRKERASAFQHAARAYYGLAKALETQRLTAPALRYRDRQHQLERSAKLQDLKLGQWIFLWLLNTVSGYGDRPGRALLVYLTVVSIFAAIFLGITSPASPIFFSGSQHLQWYEAIVLSLSSFHGRGFFPQGISLGDPVAVVAAIEAVVGLFIELVLIATFTQRFFAR